MRRHFKAQKFSTGYSVRDVHCLNRSYWDEITPFDYNLYTDIAYEDDNGDTVEESVAVVLSANGYDTALKAQPPTSVYTRRNVMGQPDDTHFIYHGENDAPLTYVVEIDGEITPNTFKYSDDGGSSWIDEDVEITGNEQQLDQDMSIKFESTTGYVAGDEFTTAPLYILTSKDQSRYRSNFNNCGLTEDYCYLRDLEGSLWRWEPEYDVVRKIGETGNNVNYYHEYDSTPWFLTFDGGIYIYSGGYLQHKRTIPHTGNTGAGMLTFDGSIFIRTTELHAYDGSTWTKWADDYWRDFTKTESDDLYGLVYTEAEDIDDEAVTHYDLHNQEWVLLPEQPNLWGGGDRFNALWSYHGNLIAKQRLNDAYSVYWGSEWTQYSHGEVSYKRTADRLLIARGWDFRELLSDGWTDWISEGLSPDYIGDPLIGYGDDLYTTHENRIYKYQRGSGDGFARWHEFESVDSIKHLLVWTGDMYAAGPGGEPVWKYDNGSWVEVDHPRLDMSPVYVWDDKIIGRTNYSPGRFVVNYANHWEESTMESWKLDRSTWA